MSQDDGARFSPQPTKNKSCCIVKGCRSKACRDLTVRFHGFPKPDADFISFLNLSGETKKMNRRDIWAEILMIDKPITENTRVCSLHFKRNDYILPDAPTQKRYLKRYAVPSCNLPVSGGKSFQRTTTKTMGGNSVPVENAESRESQSNGKCRGERSELGAPTAKVEPQNLVGAAIKEEPQDEEIIELCRPRDQERSNAKKATRSVDLPIKNEPEETPIKFESVDLPEVHLRSISTHYSEPLSGAPKKSTNFRDASTQTEKNMTETKFANIIRTNKDLKILTGIPDFSVLNTMVDVAKVTSPGLTRAAGLRFSVADRIIMTMMKLKQDLTYEALSAFFRCRSKNSCKRIILQTLETLSYGLKFAIRWPDRGEACGRLSNLSDDLANVRCIINRIEIAVRRPKEPFNHFTTFSRCKGYHSAKFMTVVTPAGLVCFLSRAYGGRTSHRTLFEQSNVVKLLERNDSVMLLKDFPVDDICKDHDITLFKSLYSRDPKRSQIPPNVRIQLNVNRRLRRFRIFRRKLTNTLSLRAEQIMTILCAIENLS